MSTRAFPKGFLWGAATSAAQIEGAAGEEGRGESVWDRFASLPGRIADASTPAVACDHYHRWREDVELLRWLGVGAYRFSIAWPRVLPAGRGTVNAAGLDFYDALVDALLAHGIQPFVTLHHWDLPQALEDRGGWRERATASAFADYAAVVTARLGDRVRAWATHNEPWCVATLGHEEGVHAPGRRDPGAALRVAHHLLLSHGWATEVIRRNAPASEVGIVHLVAPVEALSDDPADRDAARRLDGSLNRWYLDPLFRGSYPADAIADRARRGDLPGPELPFVRDGDLAAIAAPLDFLGINYYSRAVVRAGAGGEPVRVSVAPAAERTLMDWEIRPTGLRDILRRVATDYAPRRMYVTENGAAFQDPAPSRERIADVRRVEYLQDHLAEAHRAIADGVPLAGYFAWSLLDNFEWAHGYTKPFGICAVDFVTQRRIPKDSAFWYREVSLTNAVPSAERLIS